MAVASSAAADKLAEILAKYDRTGDGVINADDLMNIMSNCANGKVSETEIRRLAEAVDRGKNGKVGIHHFAGWMFKTIEDEIDEWTTDAQLKDFAKLVPPELKKLSLSFVCPDQFTDQGMVHIGAGLPANLVDLHLEFGFSWTECKISADGVGKIADGLPKGLRCLELIFKNDEFCDEALVKLGAALPRSLTRLLLSFKDNADFTDKGFCKLISNLGPDVEDLLLNFDSNTSFTDASLNALAYWLRSSNGQIKKFFVISNSNEHYSDAGLSNLCSALPKQVKELKLEFGSSNSTSDLGSQFKTNADQSVSFVGRHG